MCGVLPACVRIEIRLGSTRQSLTRCQGNSLQEANTYPCWALVDR